MKIKVLKIEDFLADKVTILELLIETYVTNLNVSKEQSTILCTEKINLIPDYINQQNAILIGAYEGEILAGFLWLYKHNYFGEMRLHINQIIVDKRFRGKSVGNQLMKEAERVAKQYEIKIIDLFVSETNLKAINMYDSIGYTTERRYMKKVL
ncbi:GNAT family N-acetyltransferase [Allobacillus sp. SKP2-8]|uniref:GNAT family N-acetyltransferase n=1 Tax=unclassified Allobacillus TaxID=2628859 RepID=UPI001181E74D|nr:GNAT family N-acetyltransferase [Allobacillus sp. SKP2-8]TSJ62544.1 GNAT family N-acetyltransferase [Allobacillus sp. SKP2-8]